VTREASLALGPVPEIGFVLQFVAIFGALGAVAAAKSFQRTKDADRRWLITTRWATFGLCVGVVLLVTLKALGVP
jgi:uncharacterized membrane protein YidH (DUF202 family)